MGRQIDLTQEYLHSIIDYCQHTGIFSWKIRDDVNISWNTRYANKKIGWAHNNGYVQVCINYKKYFLHRLAWFYTHGEWPKEIDHINRDKSDNRMANLRCVSHLDNCQNRKQRSNPYGIKGITYSKRDKSWLARITYEGKSLHIGSFKTIEDAKIAYDKKQRELVA